MRISLEDLMSGRRDKGMAEDIEEEEMKGKEEIEEPKTENNERIE